MTKYQGNAIGLALHAEGLLPPNTRLIEMVIPADGAAILRFETFIDTADLQKLIRALQAVVDRKI